MKKNTPPLDGRFMPEAEILRRRAERAAGAPKPKKTKRGRPRLGISGAIRDAEIRLMVEREVATGISIAMAQRRVARNQKLKPREVRTAWERVGPFKRSDGTVSLVAKDGGLYKHNAVTDEWYMVVPPSELAEAAADLERALAEKPVAKKP